MGAGTLLRSDSLSSIYSEVSVNAALRYTGNKKYDRSSRSRQSRGSKLILYIEEWIYERETLFLLRFEGNRLVNVESVRSK